MGVTLKDGIIPMHWYMICMILSLLRSQEIDGKHFNAGGEDHKTAKERKYRSLL